MNRRRPRLLILLLLTLVSRWALALPASGCDHAQIPPPDTVSDAATASHQHHGHHHHLSQDQVAAASSDANTHDCCDQADCCSDPLHSCDGRCGCASAGQLTLLLFSDGEQIFSLPHAPRYQPAQRARLSGHSPPLLRPPIV